MPFTIESFTSSLASIRIAGITTKGIQRLFSILSPPILTFDLYFSWCCIRVQTLESVNSIYEAPTSTPKPFSNVTTDWCPDADDWEDKSNANVNEENGNLIGSGEKVSDEDDESYSFEDSVRAGLEMLTVDDRNANTGGTPEAQGSCCRIRFNSCRIKYINLDIN